MPEPPAISRRISLSRPACLKRSEPGRAAAVTNAKDRSPAELGWVPKNAWGTRGSALLNLSYGTGRAFVIPHEQIGGVWQGAVCELPMTIEFPASRWLAWATGLTHLNPRRL